MRAADEAGEGVGGGVGGALADLGGALGEDVLGAVELVEGDDRFVGVGDDDVAEVLLAEVDPVRDGHFDGVLRPRFAEPGTQSLVVEATGDRLGAEPVDGVEVEDGADSGCLGWVRNEFVELAVDAVAKGARAARPEPLAALRSIPAMTRSMTVSRSNSANTPSIWTSIRPTGVAVSNGSVAERNTTSASASSSSRLVRSRRLREKRSTR
ncbi:hypothetical protein BKA14_008090 [Actinoplanes abujensis]|uniref:Uncharacterized protein n=1 Tax=Paractinoplanes abujensis TaxID=882441 RepID=A0A7W7G6E5_9ACTN|nr:hypothetical protein [Actinoplanes abujensis]